MNLYYSIKDQVKITMMDYIKEIMECIDKAKPKASGTKSNVALLDMFVVDKGCEKLIK